MANAPQAFGADYATTAQQTVADWARRIAERTSEGSEIIFTAEAEGALAGMAGVYRPSAPKARHSGMVWGVYVRPAWRGQGLSEGLVNACVAWARAQGITILRLAVITENTAAIRAYVRCGFRVYGVEARALCVDGVCYDELLMHQEL